MFRSRMVPYRLLVWVTAFVGVARSSRAALAKAAYLLAFAAVISLLLAPERSRGQQFRGVPAQPAFPTGFPTTLPLPVFGGTFTGFQSSMFTPPTFPGFPMLPTMPGPALMFPLNNFGTDSTGFFGFSFFPAFGGFSNFSFGALGTPFGFQGFNSVGFGSGLGLGGFGAMGSSFRTNGFGFTGFGGFSGFGGFNSSAVGGLGGFAGKGFGGFNGRKAL